MATQNGLPQFKTRLWLLLLAIFGVLATGSCTPTSDAREITTSAEDAALPTELRAFPQQLPVEGERARLTSMAEGRLVLRDGCLRLISSHEETDTGYLIIWPGDYTVKEETGALVIYDSQNQLLAQVGDEVAIGGGESSQIEPLTDTVFGLKEPTPQECPGPYWIMGDFVLEP